MLGDVTDCEQPAFVHAVSDIVDRDTVAHGYSLDACVHDG